MGLKYKVLVVEDEQSIAYFTQELLERSGYETIIAESGQDAEICARSHCPDIVLLDLGLPDMDGIAVLQSIRKWTNVPVIVISAEKNEYVKKDALDKGADDYLVKPYGVVELLARIRVALRHLRSNGTNQKLNREAEFTVGELRIDYSKLKAYICGRDAELTQVEFKLVALLGKYAGQVVPYETIMKHLWGPNSKGNNQILRVNMANIRRKIETDPSDPRYFITENGVGYRLSDS